MTSILPVSRDIPFFARRHSWGVASATMAALLLSCTAMTTAAMADAKPADDNGSDTKEIVVKGALGALPVKDVGSIFGFDKTLVDTPRSASTVSKEQMDRFGITQIYDLVSQTPGTFTSSFFGTGGALEGREIVLQGDRRDTAKAWLLKEGFTTNL